jgi:hypothetical protein
MHILEMLSELGQRGGRKNRRYRPDRSEIPQCPIKNVAEVAALVTDTIHQVQGGELDHRDAHAIGYLAGILLKRFWRVTWKNVSRNWKQSWAARRTPTGKHSILYSKRKPMNHRQRLKTIELSMTPSQAVLLWFEKTKKAGSFEQGSQHRPVPREAIAKAVESLIRRGMKAEPEHLLQEAVRQAQQEADSLYLLIIEANVAALHAIYYRNKYLMLVSGHTCWLSDKHSNKG